ncbi:uncharacterized protein LOC111025863 isoform X1 [Momordica charantia]|uniref:Uncharacterized protein LOC111025863 isoform X1 n=1 Tax=Momordica charantia TaxID=3673 RepID=A0A6J1DZV3_MOMCH|nr:uncharacterized protein LOC111025863 isoform X1 [Momordica charantia]
MVLWEITLATAYFLGLKRTYKLALKIQRRLVSPKHPRIRQFLRGRTRSIFDVAVKVHQNVQHQDIEVGKNFGNRILQWLNQMKPSAEIREHQDGAITGMKMIKQVSNSYLKHRASPRAVISQKFDQYMSITSSIRRWPKPFPTFAMIMRQPKPAGTKIQYRQYSICGSEAMETNYRRGSFDCVIREDILQWMLRS